MGRGYIAVIIRKYGVGFMEISLGSDLKDSHPRGYMDKKLQSREGGTKSLSQEHARYVREAERRPVWWEQSHKRGEEEASPER